MKHRIHIREAAESDIRSAIQWYESQQRGLGQRFELELEDTLEVIAEYPEAAGLIDPQTRRQKIRRFPYGVMYRVRGSIVQVLAVMHLHQREEAWRERS